MRAIINIPDELWESLNESRIVGPQNTHEAILHYIELGILLRHQEINGNEIQIYNASEQKVYKLSFEEEFSNKKQK